MIHYTKHITGSVPQTEPLRDDQVENNAGGYSWAVDPWVRLHRFLILGAEGGTYYQKERDLTKENAKTSIECIRADGPRVIRFIHNLSTEGRAPKMDPLVFILALCLAEGDQRTKDEARRLFNETIRTGYHLFIFVRAVTALRGWGRSLKRLVASWYEEQSITQLSFQMAKYPSREGWSHRDVVALSRPRSKDPEKDKLFRVGTHSKNNSYDPSTMPHPLSTMEALKAVTDAKDAAQIIRTYKLSHEMVSGELKKHDAVWEALLEDMPLGALIRNLGNLSSRKVIGPGKWEKNADVIRRITDETRIRKARIHPLSVLTALLTYTNGKGTKLQWEPEPSIVDALDTAFDLSFGSVTPTGKRILIGLDVSGSMGRPDLCGTPGLSPRVAAAALLLLCLRTEKTIYPMAFSHEFVRLNVSAKDSLQGVLDKTSNLAFGGTNCALPVLFATESRTPVDLFVVLTDNETWAGSLHPSQSLKEYRRKMGLDSKMAVLAMTSGGFSIADPDDPGMLDLVGFDMATPHILSEFARGFTGEIA
jgi:60 kDa SS-A/Ro ribonucleoprotein